MKILVLSSTPWDRKNSFGLTYSNIFEGIEGLHFANVYCSAGTPDNSLEMECFQISETMLIQNLKNSKKTSGKIVIKQLNQGTERTAAEQKRFDIARTLRWQILYWARELLWKIGRWKSDELKQFLDDFQPDIIFQPIYYAGYMNDIAWFAKKYTGVPMVGYIADDSYTLKQLHFSPLYWIDRFWKRCKIKKIINSCEILYVISDIQKRDYEKIFKPTCKILTKCADFPERRFDSPINEGEIRIVYGGNIGNGRWKSLGMLADSVYRLKEEGLPVRLDIYSGTPCTKAMKRALEKDGCCYLYKPIPYNELLDLQISADILVHAEGFSLKNRLEVRQSFSTKLVDFFEMGKCIFAIGSEDVASIKHLKDHDAAVIAQNKNEVYQKLRYLLENRHEMLEYEKKAYQCGAKYHSKAKMQTMIIEDLTRIIDHQKTEI